MKKKYKILITILVIEIGCVSVLNELGIAAHSWLGNVIGCLIFLVPLLRLLYLLSRDNDISEKRRTLSKIVFWYIVICFLIGMIGKAITLGLINF